MQPITKKVLKTRVSILFFFPPLLSSSLGPSRLLTTELGGFNGGDAEFTAGGGGAIVVCDSGGGGSAAIKSDTRWGDGNCCWGFRLDGGGGELGFTIGAGRVRVIGTNGFGDDEDDESGGEGGEDPSRGGFGLGLGDRVTKGVRISWPYSIGYIILWALHYFYISNS